MSKQLTVGELLSYLNNFPPEMEITFGSSKYTARPLIFYRFKQRGDDLLQIELNELEADPPETEQSNRKTAEYFIKQLKLWPSETFIEFGATIDAVSLEFGSLSNVIAINLEQNEEPLFRVVS